MVKRKGIGYIVEAFVSSLIIFIFVLSSYSAITADQQDSNIENKIMAQDATLTLSQTGYIERMMENGDPEMVPEVANSLTDRGTGTQFAFNGPPSGHYSMGIYTPGERLLNSSLESLTSDDRCSGELNETNSEFTPIHTNLSSKIEQKHGVRLYFVDRDSLSAESSRYNGIRDYDSFYVDKSERCQFSTDEGPFYMKEHVEIKNNTRKTYQINSADYSDKKFYYYETPLAAKLMDQFSRYRPARIEINNLNFTDEFNGQDVVLFTGNSTLQDISSNKDKFNSFVEDNSVILAMNVNRTVIESGVISNTGLSWVNLTKTSSATREPQFTSTPESRRIRNYLSEVGFSADQIDLKTGGNVSSTEAGTINPEPLIGSANFRYRTENWDYINSSMESGSVPPEVEDLTDCDDAHRVGIFEFPTDSGTEELTVYNTKLSGQKTNCELYGISIDKNNEGGIEEGETTFLNGDEISVNDRKYTILINSHNSAEFKYSGENKVEFLNYRKEFDDRKIENFARLPKINSKSTDSQIGLLTSSTLFIIEGEKTIGAERTGGVPTSLALSTERGVREINLRWFE